MKGLHMVSFVLVVIGALNWLLVGLFKWDVSQIWGDQTSVLSRVIYILVGLAGLVILFTHKKACKDCSVSSPSQM